MRSEHSDRSLSHDKNSPSSIGIDKSTLRDRTDVTDLRRSRKRHRRHIFVASHDEPCTRNTYRPVLLRASVRRDPADGYRHRRRPLYFYARVLSRPVIPLASLRIRRERRTSVTSQLTFLAIRSVLSFCNSSPPLSLSLSLSFFVSVVLDSVSKNGPRNSGRVLGEDSRSFLESDALFVEQGTERIKARENEKRERKVGRCER